MHRSPSFRHAGTGAIVLSLIASATAQQWTAVASTTIPTARNGAPLAYDQARANTVMFGGYNGQPLSALSDTWSFDASGWTQRSPTSSPSSRWSHGMTYDSARQRVVLFGGFQPNLGFLSDTWEWDGSNWTPRPTANSPSPRAYVSMAFDERRGRTVLFGGYEFPSSYFDQTWEYDGVNWTQIATAPASTPAGRRAASLCYDVSRGHCVLFGGGNANGVRNDTWTYDGGTWTQRTPANIPAARWGAAMDYDRSCGQPMMFGGTDILFAVDYSDTWTWTGSDWVQFAISGPSGRHGSQSAYDASQRRTIIFSGGGSPQTFRTDTWQLDGGCDRLMSTIQPPLLGRTAVFNYSYPASAAYRLAWHFLTLHFPGSFSLQVPDFSVVGEVRMDLANIRVQDLALLGAARNSTLAVFIPGDPIFLGYQFDVQSVDIDFVANRIYLAANDIETAIGPLAPPTAFQMVNVPTGSFSMGSAAIGGASAPVHTVTITRPFWMSKYEVTQADYAARMGSNPSVYQGSAYPNATTRPVDNVTAAQAAAYCAAVQAAESAAGRVPPGYVYRLPTEAEWEYACRAGTTTEWNVGSSLACPQANHGTSAFSRCVNQTSPVGSYAANALGLFDMHGNVAEWVLDRWDGTANYPSGAVNDPYVGVGPLNILRGGAWNQLADACRSAARGTSLPGLTNSSNGFRMVLAPIVP